MENLIHTTPPVLITGELILLLMIQVTASLSPGIGGTLIMYTMEGTVKDMIDNDTSLFRFLVFSDL